MLGRGGRGTGAEREEKGGGACEWGAHECTSKCVHVCVGGEGEQLVPPLPATGPHKQCTTDSFQRSSGPFGLTDAPPPTLMPCLPGPHHHQWPAGSLRHYKVIQPLAGSLAWWCNRERGRRNALQARYSRFRKCPAWTSPKGHWALGCAWQPPHLCHQCKAAIHLSALQSQTGTFGQQHNHLPSPWWALHSSPSQSRLCALVDGKG